ncbi:MAG: BspA family leucine-rich repeat surface protein [Marinifilaceae bacterium]|jgi:surface protein|nr:BspA family leucine-rich repeat surface protein [Marinifilaceae bacterium]
MLELKIGENKTAVLPSQRDLLIKINLDADVKKLRPEIKISEDATIFPKSGAVVDFTKPVVYSVTASNGRITNYNVSVVNLYNEKLAIKSFVINSVHGKIKGNNIIVQLDYGSNIDNLQPEIKISGESSIMPRSGEKVNFSEAVKYIVRSNEGEQMEYEVSVIVDELLVYDERHKSVKINDKYSENVKTGEIINFRGVSYTIVDDDLLRTIIKKDEYGKLPRLVTSRITKMNILFRDKENFNSDIRSWDVSNVIDMSEMFRNAKQFNVDIGNWDTSKIIIILNRFHGAIAFNKNLKTWNVKNIKSKPARFNEGAGLIQENLPVWGTEGELSS